MGLFKNRTVLGVVCIVIALAICFVITPLFNKVVNGKTPIVRVTKDISKGEQITAKNTKVVKVGGYNLPKNVATNESQVVGKYAMADLDVGDYILSTKVSKSETNTQYIAQLDGKKSAISLTTKSLANSVSGKVKVGDIVSIINPDYKGSGKAIIPKELTYVKVIGVTTSEGKNATSSDDGAKDEKQLVNTITLLASPEQCKRIAELEVQGNAQFSLVYRGAESEAQKFLDAQDEVL